MQFSNVKKSDRKSKTGGTVLPYSGAPKKKAPGKTVPSAFLTVEKQVGRKRKNGAGVTVTKKRGAE